MFSEAVKRIERQYEIKRTQADALFIAEKKEIYDANPKLAELDKKSLLVESEPQDFLFNPTQRKYKKKSETYKIKY